MIEKTLVLINPDADQRGLIGEILSRFEKVGLKSLFVIYKNPKTKILKMLPFQEYAVWLFDPSTKKDVLLVSYLVPLIYLFLYLI